MLDRFPSRWTTRADVCAVSSRLVSDPALPPGDPLRLRAAQLFAALARDRDVPRLLDLACDDPQRVVRHAALDALERLDPELPDPDLLRLLLSTLREPKDSRLASRMAQVVALSRSEAVSNAAKRAAEELSPAARSWLFTNLLKAADRKARGAWPLIPWLRERWISDALDEPRRVARVLAALLRQGSSLTTAEVECWSRALPLARKNLDRRSLLGLVRQSPSLMDLVLSSPPLARVAAEEHMLPLPFLVDVYGEDGLWERFVTCLEQVERTAEAREERWVWNQRTRQLIEAWPARAPSMLALLLEPRWSSRTREIFVPQFLSSLRAETVEVALRARRAEEQPEVVEAVLTGCIGDPQPADRPLFVAALEGPDPWWQRFGLNGLIKLADGLEPLSDRFRALSEQADSPELQVVAHAALLAAGDHLAIEPLLEIARAGAPRARLPAIRWLANLSPNAETFRLELERCIREREPLPGPECDCCPDFLLKAAASALVSQRDRDATEVLLGAYWRVAGRTNADCLRTAIARAAEALEPDAQRPT